MIFLTITSGRLRQRQSDSRTIITLLGIHCLEDLKHPIVLLCRDSLPIVGDRKFIRIVTFGTPNTVGKFLAIAI
jgi:hypothetical protein